MRTREDSWKRGGTWGQCDRCGFAYRLTELRTEWTGLKVCSDGCHDPRPYDLDPPQYAPEGMPVPGARPDLAADPDLGTTAQDAFYAQIGVKP